MKEKEKRPQTLQQQIKTQTQWTILQVLLDSGGRLRWKDLKKRVDQRLGIKKISPRTLTSHLKELKDKHVVRRIVDVSVYPPAVYYEASSGASMVELPGGLFFEEFYKMLKQQEETRKRFRFLSKDPEHFVETQLDQYYHDLLFTLIQYLDETRDSSRAHHSLHWIRYHIQWYETNLLELARYAKKQPKIRTVIRKLYDEYVEVREKKHQERMKHFISPFKDQELAKALLEHLSVRYVHGEASTVSAFLKELVENEELRSEVEKRFGKPIEDKRLEAIAADSAWEQIDAIIEPKK